MKQSELQARMLRLADSYPELLPLFCRLIEVLDEADINDGDVDVVLRMCQTQPDIVYLLMGIMEIVCGEDTHTSAQVVKS